MGTLLLTWFTLILIAAYFREYKRTMFVFITYTSIDQCANRMTQYKHRAWAIAGHFSLEYCLGKRLSKSQIKTYHFLPRIAEEDLSY